MGSISTSLFLGKHIGQAILFFFLGLSDTGISSETTKY